MIERVISGGQTGADRAAWRAAKRCGIATGGWMPKGYKAEDGCHPEFAGEYGAREHPSPFYPPRTKRNVEAAEFTIVFDKSKSRELTGMSNGTRIAIGWAIECGLPSCVVKVILGKPAESLRIFVMAWRLRELDVHYLNVGGNRESSVPGIGEWVEDYLTRLFQLLQAPPSNPAT